MRNKRGVSLLKIGIILIGCSLFSLGAADDRLHLKRADVLENITVNRQAIQLLKGTVVITKKDLVLTCDHARYNEKTGQGILVGNVKILQDDLTLVCDSLHHDSPNDLMMAYGNTHVWDAEYDLVSDTLFYYSELDSGTAMGQVRLIQESQVITADRLTYTKPPEAEAASYTAEGNVVITESNRVATCGKALYAYEDGITILKLQPAVQEDGRTLSGSEIELRYQDEILESIFIPSEAHVINTIAGRQENSVEIEDSTIIISHPVEFKDDLTGKILRGFFTDGELDSMRIEGMATTLYHIFEDSVYQGNNIASGDTIIMYFRADDLENIYINGGARGEFRPDTSNESIDAPIAYESDIIDYHIPKEMTDLLDNASIDYSGMNLSAGYVNVSWKNNLLKAIPSVPGDTLNPEIMPTISERGREPMTGESLTYNLETRHGKIIQGRTKTGGGYYAGNEIRNTDNTTYYINHSSYTTCDLVVPHFHFAGRRMKMINQDKVIIRPIILYIAGIPIMALPLGIFPHQGGTRHSGWIMPGYGENRSRGQFINGLGYFWAPNDYYDSRFLFDFSTKWGIRFRNYNRYNSRYRFSGLLNLEFKKSLGQGNDDIVNLFEPGSTTDYVLKWKHNQTMRHDQRLNIDATYQSNSDYNLENGIDLERRLKQQAISNLTYSKKWKKTKNSMSLNLSSSRDLMVDKKIDPTTDFYQAPIKAGTKLNITTSTLPRISFRHGQDYFFKSSGRQKRWYNNITWNYSTNLNNPHKTYYESEEVPDSVDQYRWNPTVRTFSDQVVDHTSSISGPQKIFKYITVNPSTSLKSSWVNRSFVIAGLDSNTNTIIKKEVDGFAARTTANFNLNLKTQIYGMFPINIGPLRALRHVVSPSIGYHYNPDFSKPVFGYDFGYFESITDTSGTPILLDRFAGTLAGSTPKTEAQSMSFSMNNSFQAKMLKDEKEIKRDLFTYNFSTSYNFKNYKMGILSSSLRSKLGNKLNLDLRMKHDFYEFDEELQQKTDQLRVNKYGLPAPRLTQVSMSQSFSFSGKRLTPIVTQPDTLIDSTGFEEEFIDQGIEAKPVQKPTKLDAANLWKASFSFSYTLDNPQMTTEKERFQMNSGITAQITENWRVKYNASFNLLTRQMLHHNFSIYRDLHCWELSLNWVPSGFGQGFYLQISPKSPTLKELKVEHRGGRHLSTGY